MLQVESIDLELRNKLWSVLKLLIYDKWTGFQSDRGTKIIDRLLQLYWINYFKSPINTLPELNEEYKKSAYTIIREYFFGAKWFEILDFIEFTIKNVPEDLKENFILGTNNFLAQENSAYRIVQSEIIEISDTTEIESIDSAFSLGVKSVNQHLSRSIELISDKSNPDYRNSIKESISAVEAACQIIAGKPGATLGECLKVIEKAHPLHRAFTEALSKLYGYTSDSGGIRHAMLESSVTPTYSEAKFMLVSCSAFINFLWAKAAELGLKLS